MIRAVFKEWKKIGLNLDDWGTFEGIGKGYAFIKEGRFYSVLETKKGSYRGNHIHPNKQYTILLSGRADYVLFDGEVEKTVPLVQGVTSSVDAGVPHIMVVHEDISTFEWWDGEFIAKLCDDEFADYTKGCIGPEHFMEET